MLNPSTPKRLSTNRSSPGLSSSFLTLNQKIKNISNIYSPSSVALNSHDMAHGLNEWKNIQFIVRSTFAQLVDQINEQQAHMKKQSEVIRRLEERLQDYDKILTNKATRAEVSLEVNKQIKEVQRGLDDKACLSDVQNLLDMKADHDEVKRHLDQRPTLTEVKRMIEQKASQEDVTEYLEIHTRDIMELKNSLNKKANTIEVVKELQKKANIEDVQGALETKSNISDVSEALKLKANKESVISALAKKANKSDVQTLINQTISKKANVSDVRQALEVKADLEDLQKVKRETLAQMEEMADDYKNLLATKANVSMLKSELSSKADRDEIQSTLEAISSNYVSTLKTQSTEAMTHIDQTKRELESMIHQKASSEELLQAMELVRNIKDVLAKKTDANQVKDALRTKASKEDLYQLQKKMATKTDIRGIQESLSNKADVEQIQSALDDKVDKQELKSSCEKYGRVEEISKELMLKANIKDLLQLLNDKANSKDLEISVAQLGEHLSQKVTFDAYNRSLQDQAVINEALLSQNTLGRWVWKNGKLKSGAGVPWNVQVINTNPENFIWEKDRVNIIVVQPGLYEISFGFYSRKKPTIQLHINGEAVLSAGVNSSGNSNVVYTSKRAQALSKHRGFITGLTHTDFLAIPERARVAISYSGDQKSEGFLALKML